MVIWTVQVQGAAPSGNDEVPFCCRLPVLLGRAFADSSCRLWEDEALAKMLLQLGYYATSHLISSGLLVV